MRFNSENWTPEQYQELKGLVQNLGTFSSLIERNMDDVGTWTPSFTTSGTAPNLTYAHQLGRYTRIGQLVYISCDLKANVVTSAGTGNLQLSGMPFSQAAGAGWDSSFSISFWQAFAAGTADYQPTLIWDYANTFMNFHRISYLNGASATIASSVLANNARVILSGVYRGVIT